MFFWQCRNAVSCLKVIRKRFSTADDSFLNLSTNMIPNYQSFEEVLTDNLIHVDKSLLIKDIITESTVALTRPRRWGKSLNIKMIESFFQPVFSPEGLIIEDKVKKQKFSKMLIGPEFMSYNPITEEHKKTAIIDLQGTVPVVSLSFTNVQELSTEGVNQSLIYMLGKAVYKHSYLLQSLKFTHSGYKNLLRKYITEESISLNTAEIAQTLEILLIALNKHHNKKTILLIDEYDRTLLDLREKNLDLYNYCLRIYKVLFSVIKDNSQLLQLSVFTGVTRISKESLFSRMTNIRHDSAWNTKYGEHFGFNSKELDGLIDKAHSITHKKFDKEDTKKNFANLYNGYKINNKMIYNPFSVMHCIYAIISGIDQPYQNYWANSGDNSILTDALHKVPISFYIENLFKAGEVMFKPKDGTEIDQISVDEQAFLTALLEAGYLTKANKDNHYKIPNNEVRCEYYEKFNPIWVNRVKDIYFKSIISKDEFENPETFLKIFKNRVLKFIKGVTDPKAYFQNLIYLSLIKKNMEVKEKLTKIGTNADLVIYPLNDLKKLEDTVYIIEIKLKGTNSKKFVFNEGLFHILLKNYAENEMDKNENLKIVVLRVVTFGYTKSFKWQMSIVELKFTRENMKKVIELYRSKFQDSKKWKNAFKDIARFSFSNKIV